MANALRLSPTSKPIRQFYADLAMLREQGQTNELSIRAPFQELLTLCARRKKWQFVAEHELTGKAKGRQIDGVVRDENALPRGYWEAKDDKDDLDNEIAAKFEKHYPTDNILFQTPSRIVIFHGRDHRVFDESIDAPQLLVQALELFFEYRSQEVADWDGAVDEFKETIPDLGLKLVALIEVERKDNKRFVEAFQSFAELCRQSINPNLSDAALEEMLVQHILTERIFRSVFNAPDFLQRNAVAAEIEQAVTALTSRRFSRAEFMKPLERFYATLEATARTIDDFAEKQAFLNSIYERFFRGFAVKAADTLGVVYTPQPIVEFMVRSVEALLHKEFGLSLGSPGVHIIDPFVGTGNFIVRAMRHIAPSALPHKYAHELHCNEVMLLPYYIASLNIEHEYLERIGQYQPFPGICLVDTFELAEARHPSLFTEENTERVERQRAADMMVIIGNPPYNAHQVNENDNNKNRKYPTVDARVAETYAKASNASNKNALNDPYIKAFRWATDRIREKIDPRGIVAFVSNNSFLEDFAFDGVRKSLMAEFNKIFVLDLKGDARTTGERRRKEAGNVFDDQIRVGVSIALCAKTGQVTNGKAEISAFRVDDYLRSTEKRDFLSWHLCIDELSWEPLSPRADGTWFTEGLKADFDVAPAMGTKEAKRLKLTVGGTDAVESVFRMYSNGIKTNRDAWAYNFNPDELALNMRRMIAAYNEQVSRWEALLKVETRKLSDPEKRRQLDDMIDNDPRAIAWSRDLKQALFRRATLQFDASRIRRSIYRPFCEQSLYFDRVLNEEVYSVAALFPDSRSEEENRAISVPGPGGRTAFWCLMTQRIPEVHLTAVDAEQCFPFYTYNEDGTGRTENITDWALNLYRGRFGKRVNKWDIFHYHYAVLHHPRYRERYAANLRKSLPRVPLVESAEDFKALAKAGERLGELHVNYERQSEHKLPEVWKEGVAADLRVEKMRLSKDRAALHYNATLTLEGIPPETFDYKLGSRSALEWVIDQYRVHTDKASGIENDPNRADDPAYIIRLVKKVVTVSLETQKVVNAFPELRIAKLD